MLLLARFYAIISFNYQIKAAGVLASCLTFLRNVSEFSESIKGCFSLRASVCDWRLSGVLHLELAGWLGTGLVRFC